MGIYEKSYLNLIRCIAFSVAAIIGMLAWNLWLHKDPLFPMTLLSGEQTVASMQQIPWIAVIAVSSVGVLCTSIALAGYLRVQGRAGSPEPQV